MRITAILALLTLAAVPEAQASPPGRARCVIRVGPHDRVLQGATVVVKDGEKVESAIAIQGDVVVQRGGEAVKAVALGGSVTVESGGRIVEQAVAIGGDVRLADGARVDQDALALGGQVRLGQGATVTGTVLGLSLQLGADLQSKILSDLKAEGSCRIERE